MAIVFTTGTTYTSGDTLTATNLNNVVNLMTVTCATDKLLGRVSSGSGNIEEVTCTDFAQGLLDDADAATARTTLGLGTIATQAANSVAITGGSIAGITDLAVADGGTGASDQAGARTNLGIGSMATRAVTISTSTPSGGSDGDVWFQYTP